MSTQPLLNSSQRRILATALSALINVLKSEGCPVVAIVAGVVVDEPERNCSGLHAACITDGVLQDPNGITDPVALVRDVGRALATEPDFDVRITDRLTKGPTS